jgi:hypothetical protein
MIARVASFEGVNVEVAKQTMGQAETIIRPLVENLAGYQGALELIAANGNALSISFFDSEENAQAAEPTFDDEMPRKLGELYKDWDGSRVSVERYEVLVDSRG